MRRITYLLMVILLAASTMCLTAAPITAQASIFDWGKDKKEDGEGFLDKLIDKAKDLGELAVDVYDDVSSVVKMYQSLDPKSISYQSELDEFIAAYNELSQSRQTLVDATIDITDGIGSLYDYLNEIVTVDQYSTKQLEITGEGLTYESNNNMVAEVSNTGIITANQVGVTSIMVTSKDGLSERKVNIVVKKPILSKKLKIKLNSASNSITVALSEKIGSNLNYKVSKQSILDADIKNGKLIITAKKVGKAYIYVYGDKGIAKRYKVTISK